MPRREFSAEEIVARLRQIDLALAQGTSATAAIKEAGISSGAYYRWRRAYGGMNPEQVKKLIELTRENARLRNLTAELSNALIWQPGVPPNVSSK